MLPASFPILAAGFSKQLARSDAKKWKLTLQKLSLTPYPTLPKAAKVARP